MNLRAKAAGALAAHMLFWLLMLLAFAGVLALAAALYLALGELIGRAGAAAATGGALLILVAVIGFGVCRGVRSPAIRETEKPAAPKSLDDEIRPIVGDRAADWTREHTGTAAVAALAAGIVVAASPGLRGMFFRVVEIPLRRQAARIISRYTDE